jgi:hypothetical protein
MMLSSLQEENSRLAAHVQMLESRLIQTEGSGKFQRLLYQLEMSKKRANSLAHDL